jgi:hypothetical protein
VFQDKRLFTWIMGATVGATGGLVISVLARLAPIETVIVGFLVGALAAYLYGRSHPITEEDWSSFSSRQEAEGQEEDR